MAQYSLLLLYYIPLARLWMPRQAGPCDAEEAATFTEAQYSLRYIPEIPGFPNVLLLTQRFSAKAAASGRSVGTAN